MSEAYRSMYEDNMDQMRKAAKGAMQTIKFKDGKLKVDSFTASAIMGVHAKVNPKNRASIENMINSGTKAQIMKLQSLAMKSIKSENDPTVDEHANAKPHPHPHDPEDDEDKGELADVDEKKKQPVFKGTPAQIKKQMKDWKKKHDKVKIGEEVDLDEAKNYEIKNGKIHISKANFRKVHKDYKNSTKGKERMMALDPKSGATTSYEVVFEETDLDEGKMKDIINYDKKGMSVREIAKKLGMIEYEVKALLSQPKQIQKAILSLEEVELDEYNEKSVDKEIEKSGIKKGSKEAKLIHRLLKGRRGSKKEEVEVDEKKKEPVFKGTPTQIKNFFLFPKSFHFPMLSPIV